jgi:hypothetical protein
MWGALSHERKGLPFTITAGLRQRTHSWVRVARDSWPYFTVPNSGLLQPGGPGHRIYIPQEQGGPVIPPGTQYVVEGSNSLRRHQLRLCSVSIRKAPSFWIQFSYKHSVQTPRKTRTVLLMTLPRCIAQSDTRNCLPIRCLETDCITPLFYCCVRVLLNKGYFCGSTVLARGIYATMF